MVKKFEIFCRFIWKLSIFDIIFTLKINEAVILPSPLLSGSVSSAILTIWINLFYSINLSFQLSYTYTILLNYFIAYLKENVADIIQ